MQPALYRRLSELVDRSRVERHTSRSVWTRRLFEALDWGDRAAFSVQQDQEDTFHLCVDKTAVVSVVNHAPSEIDEVYKAVNRAYNQDVPWVVATNFSSFGLFGSYWVSFPHDLTNALAWKIEADEYLLEATKLNLLTPHELARNEIDQLYDVYPLRKRRLPIDIHLVDRMATWREMALDVLSSSASKDDSLIHRLINSLFIVRYLEDAGVVRNNLSGLLTRQNDPDFLAGLRELLDEAGTRSGYPTIKASQLARLQTTPLRTLIRDLYGYETWGVKYDFSAMSVDILGRFYEEYLRYKPATKKVRRETESLFLFDEAEIELKNVRRERGIYYTPRFVVQYIVSNLISRHEATSKDIPRIADLACGSGTFLVSALDELQKRASWKAKAPKAVYGFDNDERAVEAARLNLTAKCISDRLKLPLESFNLVMNDLIAKGPSSRAIKEELPKGADIVVGNPPYIKYETLIKSYDADLLKRNFSVISMRADSYMLFIEAALTVLSPGGCAGLVLPNTFLRSSSGAELREFITNRADILEIVDFQDQPVFQHVGAYVCILLFRKRADASKLAKVGVIKVYNLSSTPSAQLAKLAVSSEGFEDGGESFQIDQPKNRAPWVLRNTTEIRLLKSIEKSSTRLSETGVELRQGIKTGDDATFVVEIDGRALRDGGDRAVNAIESEVLIPYLRAREMRRWYGRTKACLVYPYDQITGELIPWPTLQKKYPGCAAYLLKHKAVLAARRSLGKSPWYSLIRPRTTTVFGPEPKLFIGELTLRPTVCAPDHKRAGIAGSTGGGSWIVINSTDYSELSLMAYLNSVLAEWYFRQVASQRRGGWLLIEQQVVLNLPVPEFLKDKESFARSELERLATMLHRITKESSGVHDSSLRKEISGFEEQIDSLVIEALNLSAEEGRYIRQRVTGLRGAGAVRTTLSLF